MWKEITLFEFTEYRKHYNMQVLSGELYGGGDFTEWGETKFNSRIRWESTPKGSKWFKFAIKRRK